MNIKMNKVKYLSVYDIERGLSPIIRLWDREIEPITKIIKQMAPQASLLFYEGPNRQKKKHEYPSTFSRYNDYKIVGCEGDLLIKVNKWIWPILESWRKEEYKKSCRRIIKVHKIHAKCVDKLVKQVNPDIYLKSHYTRQAYNRLAEAPFKYSVHNARDKDEGDKVTSMIHQNLRGFRILKNEFCK